MELVLAWERSTTCKTPETALFRGGNASEDSLSAVRAIMTAGVIGTEGRSRGLRNLNRGLILAIEGVFVDKARCPTSDMQWAVAVSLSN